MKVREEKLMEEMEKLREKEHMWAFVGEPGENEKDRHGESIRPAKREVKFAENKVYN